MSFTYLLQRTVLFVSALLFLSVIGGLSVDAATSTTTCTYDVQFTVSYTYNGTQPNNGDFVDALNGTFSASSFTGDVQNHTINATINNETQNLDIHNLNCTTTTIPDPGPTTTVVGRTTNTGFTSGGGNNTSTGNGGGGNNTISQNTSGNRAYSSSLGRGGSNGRVAGTTQNPVTTNFCITLNNAMGTGSAFIRNIQKLINAQTDLNILVDGYDGPQTQQGLEELRKVVSPSFFDCVMSGF